MTKVLLVLEQKPQHLAVRIIFVAKNAIVNSHFERGRLRPRLAQKDCNEVISHVSEHCFHLDFVKRFHQVDLFYKVLLLDVSPVLIIHLEGETPCPKAEGYWMER